MKKQLHCLIASLLVAAPTLAFYDYQHVPQLFTTGALVDVAFHPGGSYALAIERAGKVLRIEQSDLAVSQVGDLGATLNRMAFSLDGSYALLVGRDSSGNGRVYRYDHTSGNLLHLPGCDRPGVDLRAVAFDPSGDNALVIGFMRQNSAGGILYAYLYDPQQESLSLDVATNAWGPYDVSYKPDGSEAIVVIGENDRGAFAYRPAAPQANRLLSVSYGSIGSNARNIEHHPHAGYGLMTDGAGNVLKYVGTWSKVDLPAGFYMENLDFNASGSKALLVGRAKSTGSGYSGGVMEFVGDRSSFAASDFVNVSIPGFDQSPWLGDGNSWFNAVAFRPGHCDGLIVGQHSSYRNVFAPIAFFVDLAGPDCLGVSDAGPTPDSAAPDTWTPDTATPDLGGNDTWSPDASVIQVDAGRFDRVAHDAARADTGLSDLAAPPDQARPDRREAEAGSDGGGSTSVSCNFDDDCFLGLYCREHQCARDCQSDGDCTPGLRCDDRGRCRPPLDAGPVDSGPADHSGSDVCVGAGCAALPCDQDSQCGTGFYCQGYCVPVCYRDQDCPNGMQCRSGGRCLPATPAENPPEQGCQCAAAPGTHAAPWMGLALVSLWLARRRRR